MGGIAEPVDQSPLVVEGWKLYDRLRDAGAITDTGLRLNDFELTQAQAESLAFMLATMKRWTSWALGDLIVYCVKAFGDDITYGEIAEATGFAYQTVQNLARVSRRVPPSRRKDGMPWSMHEAVAKFEPEQQRELLDTAEREGWKRETMREHLKVIDPPVQAVSPAAGEPDVPRLVAAAWDVVRYAREAGDNMLVRRTDILRLSSALGEP